MDAEQARCLAQEQLALVLPRTWSHVQGVALRASVIAPVVGDQAEVLVSAAWLHDIGYSPTLSATAFHPLDGARYLASLDLPRQIVCLVAHHSCALLEAKLRGLASEMADFDDEGGSLRDALWYCSKSITINGSTAVIGGQRVEGTTKSGRTRIVTIDAETAAVLGDHAQDQAEQRDCLGEAWLGAGDDYVFTTSWGEPVYPDTVTSLMGKIIKLHNQQHATSPLPPVRLHDLRHIHATTLLLAGVPVHVVAARLGHADPSVTLRVYAHVIRSAEASAADVFARVMKTH